MSVEIRRGSDRFVDRTMGARTLHAFSFGESYDPERVSFGPMVCHDDHLLKTGKGFPDHPHAGLVIVSWVVSGAITHSDSTGASVTLRPGDIGVLRAGVGVAHSEIAADTQTRFVQVWLSDPDPEIDPTFDVLPAPVADGGLNSAGEPLPGALLWVAQLADGQSVTIPAAPRVHLYVARGALLRSSLAEPLHEGDAFLFTDEPSHEVTAGGRTDLLCWTFE